MPEAKKHATLNPSQEVFAVPDEKIERLRSLLAHSHDQEKVDPTPLQAHPSSAGYAVSADEIEHLRSLLACVHDREKKSPFRRLVSQITDQFTPRVERSQPHPGKNKDAA
jgi:hypothetical protein